MLDFIQVKERKLKNDIIEVYPDFKVIRSKDLMIRGKSFYSIWDDEKQLWSTDEYDLQRLVDKELAEYRDGLLKKDPESNIKVKWMNDFSTGSWAQYRTYVQHLSDNFHQLDVRLTFANTEVKKKDFVSRKLPYPLEAGPCDAYDELMSVLYGPEDRAKLEWAIGAVVAGEGKDIQKFIVLYGPAGSGKSTVLNIVQKLFVGYYTTFDAKALTSNNNSFALEMFKGNPLVAIDHDTDMSKIEDNSKLNSIVGHDDMTINEKNKPQYTARANAFLFVGTNRPVKITEAKSGIIRRLIDVRPSGNKVPVTQYNILMQRIEFELGAIANKCLGVYRSMGKHHYDEYRPLDMILQTDVFFNFIEDNQDVFREEGGISLKRAYEMYKAHCDEALVEFKLPRHKFREELKNYFATFEDVTRVDGRQVRSYYSGLVESKFTTGEKPKEEDKIPGWLHLSSPGSAFDEWYSGIPAQYASLKETPLKKWSEVTTTLADIDSTKLHYVVLPENQIVIDFDLKDDTGQKSMERNLEAASKFPPTYAEFSKSGKGVHLHYNYEGDPLKLSSLFSEGIEILVVRVGQVGPSSLRRKVSFCNSFPVASLKEGSLPVKEDKPVINGAAVKSERGLRDLIERNLRKEIHPATKPSVDFIKTILDDAYKDGLSYDVSDLQSKILAFAAHSTHQADACIKLVAQMHFSSEKQAPSPETYDSDKLVFFDVEVFPNLLVVCWKVEGKDNKTVIMINPTGREIEALFNFKLVGFNCRRYDNHILYARFLGYDNERLYRLSQKIIDGENRAAMFGPAYNISYTDVYDFSSVKQSLKKFEIELGIHHEELGLPFDQPVPEELWPKVGKYCVNDVVATEATFFARHDDFVARQILAELSGLTVNDTTQMHTAKIIFGDDENPQTKFVYTDLSEMFPGYVYESGKSTYRGEEVGEGGYVYSEPGAYSNVALLDVASMHPSSIELLDLFGPYTGRYSEIKSARIAIKHKDFESAKKMLGGVLEKYLTSKESADSLAYALKIALNIVYGLTSAKFNNKFRDPRNVDNIVAKRGALFMIDLKNELQKRGARVVHIKTDSVKIANATKDDIDFVIEFGKKHYGYDFEHEATYKKLCLVNDAVYIAQYQSGEWCWAEYGYIPKGNRDHPLEWTATGAEFAHPYIFKTLFSREPIEFGDLCETKSVTSFLYLDMNEALNPDEHNYMFVGKTGSFCPIKPGCGGGLLMRKKPEDEKYSAVTGTKGRRWLEAELVQTLGKEADIDETYYRGLVDDAIDHISKFTDFDLFRSDSVDVIPF